DGVYSVKTGYKAIMENRVPTSSSDSSFFSTCNPRCQEAPEITFHALVLCPAAEKSPPCVNELNLNINAAVNDHEGKVGIGMVIRGTVGSIFGAIALVSRGIYDPYLAKCLAF
ncbi:hypothetical protein TorRG33x02_341170, partial [Trema orientale]